ncbi:MAG: hypothetical protein HOV77_30705 [Hamadaea sp.]|uniref:MSCRAMM family protein n=1 Tax=Hamadaea sp. TaxID=2024425 RepID=UPI0017A5A79E|nr:carboxypeptidase regulatory-like domain-containing protein [Hamadaea sp.]NUT23561.1 hypothetical protein [Hamadaea sp.]
MSRSRLRRIGSIALATAIAVLGLTPPAHAATPGTIAGTLTYHGAPVANASVYVSPEDTDSFGSSSTDAAGRYSIGDLAPGHYKVVFQAAGHPMQYAYGKADDTTATLIAVTTGATTTVNDALVDPGTISGVLTDSHGGPVAYASVSAYSPTGGNAYAMTASDGSYAIAVFPGSYKVAFNVGSIEQYAHGKTYSDADVFTVAANQVVTVNETLVAAGSIAGHVTRFDGSPAANVQVEAAYADGGSGPFTTTDDSGAYRLDFLKTGAYKMVFSLESGATQAAPDQRSLSTAQTFTVTDGAAITVDESLLPTGSIKGRFTSQAGAGIDGVSVQVTSGFDREWGLYATTDSNGYYAIDDVFVDSGYRVGFSHWDQHIEQWATSKLTVEQADQFAVTAGAITTVDDKKLPTGSIKLTVKDSISGAVVNSFYANVGPVNGEATTGSLILDDVAAGSRTLEVSADGYVYKETPVTVVAGQETAITVTLVPTAKIKVKVVDGVTGAGLQGFIVLLLRPGHFVMPDGIGERTAADGSLTVDVQQGGQYHLFVFPKSGSGYGAQWVGRAGGTGTEPTAQTFTLSNGTTLAGPTIKMDKAGVITGKVTSTTGKPIKNGTVTMAPQSYHSGGGLGAVEVAADGTYKMDFLGPYTWPLLFTAGDHAFQWSDGTADRYHNPSGPLPRRTTSGSGGTTTVTPVQPPATTAPGLPRKTTTADATATSTSSLSTMARPTSTVTTTATGSLPRRTPLFPGVKVVSGQTTVFNYTMKTGVSVKTSVAGLSEGGFIDVYNAVTGDIVGIAWADDLSVGTADLLIPGARVRFYANAGTTETSGWCGGGDYTHAATYTVTSAPTQAFACVVH